MIVTRRERWGKIYYDTRVHRFSYTQKHDKKSIPYTKSPVLLNLDLTMKCNLHCRHCVARDFGNAGDLVVSQRLLRWINSSPFMVVVITGGEPLLSHCEHSLMTLLSGIRKRALIVDTNGTIAPSRALVRAMVEKDVLVRVSWDTARRKDELRLRRRNGTTKENELLYDMKVDAIPKLKALGLNVAVQTVVHGVNVDDYSFRHLPDKLREMCVRQWYLQRMIPSCAVAEMPSYMLSTTRYFEATQELVAHCQSIGIDCIAKADRRHNSVFLVVGDGLLYTQGNLPGQKILLGPVWRERGYFDYVSGADHADRYYGAALGPTPPPTHDHPNKVSGMRSRARKNPERRRSR